MRVRIEVTQMGAVAEKDVVLATYATWVMYLSELPTALRHVANQIAKEEKRRKEQRGQETKEQA